MLGLAMIIVMCVLLIGGCGTDTAKTRDTSVLRISVGYEPGSLNPVKAFAFGHHKSF